MEPDNHGDAIQDDEDDFFGDDGSHDDLPEREMRAQEQQFHSAGYLEAFEASKEEKLQKGFEDGYTQSFDISVSIGELLAEAALDGNKDVVNRIKEFLQAMGKSEKKPSVSHDDLDKLCNELLTLRSSK